MNEITDNVTQALQVTRPNYTPGDVLRRKGTAMEGTFLKWHDKWVDYIVVRCEGMCTRVEPAREWERV